MADNRVRKAKDAREVIEAMVRIDPWTGWDTTFCHFCDATDDGRRHDPGCAWLVAKAFLGEDITNFVRKERK